MSMSSLNTQCLEKPLKQGLYHESQNLYSFAKFRELRVSGFGGSAERRVKGAKALNPEAPNLL